MNITSKTGNVKGKGKGKVNPRTGYESPEGEKCSSTLSLTSALGGSGWSAPRPGRFTPGNAPVPTVQQAGWAPGPVWTGEENLARTGIRSPDRSARGESLYRLSNPGPRQEGRTPLKWTLASFPLPYYKIAAVMEWGHCILCFRINVTWRVLWNGIWDPCTRTSHEFVQSWCDKHAISWCVPSTATWHDSSVSSVFQPPSCCVQSGTSRTERYVLTLRIILISRQLCTFKHKTHYTVCCY